MAGSDLGAPAGALHDYITHATYLALHFLGDRGFDDVRARWALVGDDSRARYDDLTAVVGAGAACRWIRISGRPRPFCFINVRGTAGAGSTDLFQPYLRIDGEDPGAPLRALTDQAANGARLIAGTAPISVEKVLQQSPLHGLERLLGLFYESVVTGAPSPVTDEQVMATSRLIDAIIAEASSSTFHYRRRRLRRQSCRPRRFRSGSRGGGLGSIASFGLRTAAGCPGRRADRGRPAPARRLV